MARLDAMAIDPDLTGPEQLFEPAMRERREPALEPAVEPELGFCRRDGDGADAAHRLMRKRLRFMALRSGRHRDLRISGR